MSLFALLSCVSCGRQNQSAESWHHPAMNYRPLGNTGIEVSEISIGCNVFGCLSEDESYDLMTMALDSGINYIDVYDAEPVVRDNIGHALKGRRDRIIIQGHIGCCYNGEQYQRTRDMQYVKEGFEDLLKRLGTDHIEVGMLHFCDDMDDWNAILNGPMMAYAKELKKSGRIQHIGLSSHNTEVALAAVKSGAIEVLMFGINPIYDALSAGTDVWDSTNYKNMLMGVDPLRAELYDYCARHHIAVVAMKVFGGAGGRLLQAERTPFSSAMTPPQCLSYVLSKPCVSTALCGVKTKEQLLSDLYYRYAGDGEKDFSAVRNGDESAVRTGVKDGVCTYCTHCSPCPKGINIAKVNELLDLATAADTVPASVAARYKVLKHKAGECIQCGACESRCPFSVSIRKRMKEARRVFGE